MSEKGKDLLLVGGGLAACLFPLLLVLAKWKSEPRPDRWADRVPPDAVVRFRSEAACVYEHAGRKFLVQNFGTETVTTKVEE